ncbi:hypothetical protein H2204_006247 [Knufia peltigerae]|uniref:Uncharacterized protein n=1 Tax=Knufia peltigerae TaxID=1002370 RepID=A0AA39CZ44_9EURO|nr:hypothetical protein H2204_006247 [Knufia peltigerae]
MDMFRDGHTTKPLAIRLNAGPHPASDSMAEERPPPHCPAKRPSLPLHLSSPRSDHVTSRGFQYFRENTIPSFLYVNPSPQALYVFQHLLPQSYHTEPAIEQAVLAIASAQELAHAPVDQRGSLEATLLRSYGRTLRLLGDTAVKPSVLVMMLACFVFVGFETFRESPKAASLHLQNGLRILRQWRRNLQNYRSPSSSSEDHIISHYIQPVFAGIEVIFSRSSVSDIVQVGDLEYQPPVLPSDFTSLLEARGKMIELWMYFFSKHPPEHIDAVAQLQALPLWERWHVKLLQYSRNSGSWSVRAQLHARLLHVFYNMVSVALQCQRYRDETVWDKHIEDFEKMFQTCYDICQNREMYLDSKDPNDMGFGMLPGVLPPLWLLGMSCRDPMMRRRAAELIRMHHRQCGQVDECSAAVLVDAVIQLEEEGTAIARTCGDITESHRVRVLESDLTKPGKMTVVFTRAPYTQRQTVDVAYSSSTTLPSRPYRLWPIVASMDLIGYHGLIRATGRTCVCKVYGQ